ncbi:endonuclease III domain-containing protein [Athalassotoga saccharophila]|uniref:endonuclease III domain-containing protein n=1 Tax=Athalassotoga saccharophila TaxID=1441386 RepID=UPI00137B3418|nr:endonuclease III [Athalassotoga saccharophila]BBJ27175.1 endonuclease III [Athalassotoga saccharophila]
MIDKELSKRILLCIIEKYPRKEETKDPFQVLISTVLSQRTRDANTAKASRALFSKFPTAYELSKAEISEVERLIRSVGMYKQKAERIVNIAREIVDLWDGKVPSTLDDLIKFSGVGRKTANIVLAVSYDLPVIAVDVHVHRIANRIGIVKTKTPFETEMALTEIVPEEYRKRLNGAMVNFGQTVCLPRNPRCMSCTFKEVCEYGQSVISGSGGKESNGSRDGLKRSDNFQNERKSEGDKAS